MSRTISVLIAVIVLAPIMASGQINMWSVKKPACSVGAEITSTTMIAFPIAAGILYDLDYGYMIYANIYLDDKIPIAIQCSGSYSNYFWQLGPGIGKKLYLNKKSRGLPAKKFYVAPFLGGAVITRIRAIFSISLGIDFR